MDEQPQVNQADDAQAGAVPPQAVEAPYPAKIIICGMGLIVVVGLLMFGLADRLAQGWELGFDAPESLRHAATALIVGGVIAIVFEMVIHRQASAAFRQVLRLTFRPVVEGLQQQAARLDESIKTADKAIKLSHVMAVAQTVGISDIFRDRHELFERELRVRLEGRDIKALRMMGVSLRDMFAGDGPLYEVLARLNDEVQRGRRTVMEAIIMKGDCADADLRIEVEEGAEFARLQRTSVSPNWRRKSRLWKDYERVTDSWELHFKGVELYEFDHLPTAWVMLVEAENPGDCAVYVEQYHYGRIGITTHGRGGLYSCLGGKVPVLKFAPGTAYEIFRNHLEIMKHHSTRRSRDQHQRVVGAEEAT